MKDVSEFIYKIATQEQWDKATATGLFKGAPVDLSDGYIHFSTAEQAIETIKKHFHGQHNLLLIKVASAPLGKDLQWEISRGGALFPHLYADLKTSDAISVVELNEDDNGGHIFPEEL